MQLYRVGIDKVRLLVKPLPLKLSTRLHPFKITKNPKDLKSFFPKSQGGKPAHLFTTSQGKRIYGAQAEFRKGGISVTLKGHGFENRQGVFVEFSVSRLLSHNGANLSPVSFDAIHRASALASGLLEDEGLQISFWDMMSSVVRSVEVFANVELQDTVSEYSIPLSRSLAAFHSRNPLRSDFGMRAGTTLTLKEYAAHDPSREYHLETSFYDKGSELRECQDWPVAPENLARAEIRFRTMNAIRQRLIPKLGYPGFLTGCLLRSRHHPP